MKSGIYRIRNLVNGKVYIGSAANLRKRWIDHQFDLNCQRHGNSHLQRSWDKYGIDNFVYEILEEVEKTLLLEREQFYLDQLVGTEGCYNILPTAGSWLGGQHTQETRAKISAANKGHKHTDEARARISDGHKGMRFTEEHKAKIGAANKGKVRSPEARAKVSAARKGKPMSKPRTAEHVARIQATRSATMAARKAVIV